MNLNQVGKYLKKLRKFSRPAIPLTLVDWLLPEFVLCGIIEGARFIQKLIIISLKLDSMEINISQRLKDLRKQHQYSQKQIANGIGMKRCAYQAYEEDRAAPSVTTLFKLSEFYGFYSLDLLLDIAGKQRQIITEFTKVYHSANPDRKKIVDFILAL
jgi:transcriptional regulator with XRE-family HTH domain